MKRKNPEELTRAYVDQMTCRGYQTLVLAFNMDKMRHVSRICMDEDTLRFAIFKLCLCLGDPKCAYGISTATMAAAEKMREENIDRQIKEMFDNLKLN